MIFATILTQAVGLVVIAAAIAIWIAGLREVGGRR